MIYKNAFRKIRKSLGRYLSIFLIVMIGVGFYAGIQSTAPDIRNVAETYYSNYNLMDFKVVSTLGLTDDDVNYIRKLDDVQDAFGSYSLDVLIDDKAIRIHSIEESVNRPKLIEGELPSSSTECLADARNHRIGDIIRVTDDVDDELKHAEYRVTGLIESVLYLQSNYGSTTVGDGKLSSFVFIDKNEFLFDAFTEIYVIMNGSHEVPAYTDEYKKMANTLDNRLTAIQDDRQDTRYAEIYDEAMTEIEKNEKKLSNEKADGENQLKEAKKKLDEGMSELNKGKAKLEKSEKELNSSISKQITLFNSAQKKIDKAWSDIDSALTLYGIKRGELGALITSLDASINAMKTQLSKLQKGTNEYNQLLAQIELCTIQYKAQVKLQNSIITLEGKETKLKEGKTIFNKETAKARAEIKAGKEKIEKNEKTLLEGRNEYNKNLGIFNKKINDAEGKIADAKEEIEDIEPAKWVIWGREAASGYDGLDNDTEVIDSIARVFPIFFIAIVVLMTSNTMARMISEERSEIGTLSSLGYSDSKIIKPYLVYVLSASCLGALSGYFLGCNILPPLIYKNFLTILPPLVIKYNITVLVVIMFITVTLMSAVTITACRRKLKKMPAALLRPLPPRHGQKILLQHVGIIWNHLSFIWKVTMRNMFRFKKRALMTIIGVAGCTALLLVGFGLRDSMDGVVDKQYDEISKYDNMVVLNDEVYNINGELNKLISDSGLENPLLVRQESVNLEIDDIDLDIFVLVPKDSDNLFEKHFHLRDKDTGKEIHIDDSGAIITQKISETFDVNIGDKIEITDNDNRVYYVNVSGIAENYISNYIYMNSNMYLGVFGKDSKFNIILADDPESGKSPVEELMDSDQVLNVTMTDDIKETAMDTNAQLNSIVIVLVVVASLLAFIVLYNLTSINISERTREIATLKVLGFRETETNAYIYRESLILTILSILIGLALGTYLHNFVVDAIEGTTRVFIRKIDISSFVLSASLTMLFAIVMQVLTFLKLRTVNMIESLKSVE